MFLPAKLYKDREDHTTLVSNHAVVTKAIPIWSLTSVPVKMVPFLLFPSVTDPRVQPCLPTTSDVTNSVIWAS